MQLTLLRLVTCLLLTAACVSSDKVTRQDAGEREPPTKKPVQGGAGGSPVGGSGGGRAITSASEGGKGGSKSTPEPGNKGHAASGAAAEASDAAADSGEPDAGATKRHDADASEPLGTANTPQLMGAQPVAVLDEASGITIASDAAGVLHAAVVVRDNTGDHLAYGRCAQGCDKPAAWSFSALMPADLFVVPTLRLTAAGQPRIAYSAIGASPAPGHYYASCDTGCDAVTNWTFLQLTGNTMPDVTPRPKLPFAVSGSGAATLLHTDNSGAYAAYCPGGCTDASAWTDMRIGDYYTSPQSAAFASDGTLYVSALVQSQDANSLQLMQCGGDCAQASSWGVSEVLLQTPFTIFFQSQISATPRGAPQLTLYMNEPNVAGNERKLFYLSCNADCDRSASWSVVELTTQAMQAEVGFVLEHDAQGGAVVAFAALGGVAYLRCSSDCGSATSWQKAVTLETLQLDALYPLLPPSGCEVAKWLLYSGPSLAFQSAKPVLAFGGDKIADIRQTTGSVCSSYGKRAFVVLP